MMEPTDNDNGEYSWAMKKSLFLRKSHNWKDRRPKPLSEMDRYRYEKWNSNTEEAHVKIMASMVPDEIIYNLDYSKREFEACLLFGDVSGFTDLCEKFNKTGSGGPSKLTQVLNGYIGAMVQEVLSHNGDVLKFSGDAFIALFKETGSMSLRNRVHDAINCALVIQKSYGNYKTDFDVIIKVKLAIACGHLAFSLIGDKENSHYIMNGQPIIDIKAAENLSKAGDIILAGRVTHYITLNEYLLETLPDNFHVKVLGVGPNWRNVQRQYESDSDKKVSLVSAEDGQDEMEETGEDNTAKKSDDSEMTVMTVGDQYSLRPAVNFAARNMTKAELRRFIIPPVMSGIDADEPVEYLTEVRQVVILFINCKVTSNIPVTAGIDVANEVYLNVCRIVKENYACVNKISNFDKDLMLLVIYGLRGFKYELESRMALKSALECQQTLLKQQYVEVASVAVTTGKTYCGAFGHTLRREYTVIGLIVNKAARLMVAYPNKVTCDRETFLQSKLEAKNFIQQEYIPLKGIKNPGTIYEFKEVEKSHEMALHMNPLPLLGREQEMDLFHVLFRNAIKYSKTDSKDNFINTLVIQGVYRQGKTRLLAEMMHATDVPVVSFMLTRADYDIPYYTIRLIFSRFLSSMNKLAIQERMIIITSYLKDPDIVPYLRVLNAVFDVNYPSTPEYHQLNSDRRYEKMQSLFVKLCEKCFKSMWLIVIDDAEYIDDESWLLMEILMGTNFLFFTLSMGLEKELSMLALHVLQHPRIKRIRLKGIDKWYHIGLICQMLKVDGVPAELEKIIQVKSTGNPGWIESFLISVRQSNGIYIKEMSRETAYQSGIVVAPLYMLIRLNAEEMKLWTTLMEDSDVNYEVSRITGVRWKMFIDSCRESFPDLGVARTFRDKSDMVNIALSYEEFALEDVEPEQDIDVIILKTFDSLTSYEQMLLKSSSVLGDIFQRDMLLYIMSSAAFRLTALAVKKLFEIHVLCCARGDFIEGGLTFKARLINPNEDMNIKCDCKGLIIDESCLDLPKYASCGYLRFRSSEFRQTTYDLLTDNQKRDFHEKAIRYLERETRRCRACGNGYFVRQMGIGRLDHTLRLTMSKRKRKKSISDAKFSDLDSKERRSSFFSLDSSFTSKFGKERGKSMWDAFGSSFPTIPDSGTISEAASASVEISAKTLGSLSSPYLTKTFSTSDFSQCTCTLILDTMYFQLIEHCRGAKFDDKLLNAIVEYSYICVGTMNIPQAFNLLDEGMQLLNGTLRQTIELAWMVDLKKGKLVTLLGIAKMRINEDESYDCFLKALKYYGVSFPWLRISRKLKNTQQKLRNFFRYHMSIRAPTDNSKIKKVNDDYAQYHNDVSETLCYLSEYFMKKSQWAKAELAANWSLARILKTQTDFEKICLAFAQLIRVNAIQARHKTVARYELFALKTCHMKKTYVELDELKAITQLYYSVCFARLARGHLDKFLQVAYVTWRLSTSSQSEHLTFQILPLLASVCLVRRQVIEFGNLLQEIIYIMDQDIDNSCKCWYHALALQLQVETGIALTTYSRCISFLRGEGLELTHRDPGGKLRLLVLIWLWLIRLENWDEAECYRMDVWNFKLKETGENVHNLMTACYLLEGLIIYLVHKLDMKNLPEIMNTDRKITNLLKTLKKCERSCVVIRPRVVHLHAYYTISKYSSYNKGFRLLSKAAKTAEYLGTELEITWVKHNQLAWLGKLPREDHDLWKEHVEDDVLIDFRDIEYIDKSIQFSLPLPLYV